MYKYTYIIIFFKIPNLIIEIGIKGSPKIEKTATVTNYLESLELEPLCIVSINEFTNKLIKGVYSPSRILP